MAGTKPDDILSQTQESLRGSVYACTLLVKLSGGNANFLYRGTLAQSLPDGSTTVIIKHSAPFMATHPAFKLPSERSVSGGCLFLSSVYRWGLTNDATRRTLKTGSSVNWSRYPGCRTRASQ
jgi:hypothetical protein